METKQTIKNCNTQKLFILNELSKTVDLNLFNQIDFNFDNEQIELSANYNYDLCQLLNKTFGMPKTYFRQKAVHLIYESETAIFILIIETLNQ